MLTWCVSADVAFAICGVTVYAGTNVTFECADPASESVTFTESSGLLQHSIVGNGFNSASDFDNTTGGDQTLSASTTVEVRVNLTSGGPDHVIIGTPPSPAGRLLASFLVTTGSNNNGATIVIDDSGSTVVKSILNNNLGISAGLSGGERLQLSLGNHGVSGGITLLTGTGADTVTIPDMANVGIFGAEPRTVTATNGDTVNVGAGTLNQLQQQVLTINAAGPTNAVVNIQDQNTTTANTYTYTSTSVTRGDTPATTVTINTSNVAPPSLSTGTNNDTILVRSALAGSAPTINGGGGDDTITIAPSGPGGLEAFTSGLSIVGGAGTGDVVTVDDTGDGDPNTYPIGGSTVTRNGFAGITLDVGVETVRLLAGSGANTFNLAAATYRVDIVGNTSADTLNVPNGYAASGTTFDGDGGANAVNYAAYTTPVTVNLATGAATGLGLVSNVSMVTGGSAGDTLTGGPGIDTLNGGPGPDLISGGPGNDILNGDADDDGFLWEDGDGTDTMAGGPGTDGFQIAGTNGPADVVVIAASGPDVSVTRSAPSPFVQVAGPTQGIERVFLLTLGGDDQVNVQSVPTGMSVSIDTGLHNDAITLDSNGGTAGGTVKNILGRVLVSGGLGTNSLSIVDADSASGSVATITHTQVGAAGGDSLFGTGVGLTYGSIDTLNITFGSGNDTAKVATSAATTYTIVGGPQPAADTIDINLTDTVSPALTGSAGNGQFTAANRKPITFTGFETLLANGASANGVLQLAAPTYTVDETAGTAVVTIQRMGGTLGAVSATVIASDGTATAPADYGHVLTRVDFAHGETSKTVGIPIAFDGINEPSETVNVTLSNPTGGAVLGAQMSAVLTITNAVPTTACTPRPRLQTQPVAGGNRLQVHVEATPLNTGANNLLSEVRFGQFDNARVAFNGQPVSAGQAVTLPPNSVAIDFTVERVTAGQATTVHLTVVDGCGEWQTFVGGGTGAGF